MPYNIVVLAKQVPDTKNITGEAMKEDGTVNRDALPKIFNPEDLNALEMALSVRDEHGGKVTVITMGPPAAAELLRDSLMRGADEVVLLTDRKFAVADTLATAYALCKAIEKVGNVDMVFCGRQAIDGDTAQIGPQVAGKLDLPQVTYAEDVLGLDGKSIKVRRNIEGGFEVVQAPLPLVLTVTSNANEPRPERAKRVIKFKKARTASEVKRTLERGTDEEKRYLPAGDDADAIIAALEAKGLLIPEWDAATVDADPEQCGFAGSPTRVKEIDRVVLQSTDHESVEPTKAGLAALMRTLAEDHIIG